MSDEIGDAIALNYRTVVHFPIDQNSLIRLPLKSIKKQLVFAYFSVNAETYNLIAYPFINS
jgi:hypothetical protein